jgi:arylamine N-acetyltransferase
MAKNKSAEANRAFSKAIQKALSTLGNPVWKVLDHPQKGQDLRLYALVPPLALKNQTGEKVLILSAYIITAIVGDKEKRVKTREYIYQIAHAEDKKALYEFHWHPEKIDRVTLEAKKLEATDKAPFPHPHLHVRATDDRFDNLKKRHIPSGRVAFEDILGFIIRECNVKAEKANWEAVLKDTRKEFENKHQWL